MNPMRSVLCVALAHRAAESSGLQAEGAAATHDSEPHWLLGKIEALRARIPTAAGDALHSITSSLTHEQEAAKQVAQDTGHKFAFLLDGAEKKSVTEALLAIRDLGAVEHEVDVSAKSLAHHLQHSPSSFLQEKYGKHISAEDLQTLLTNFESTEHKGQKEIANLDDKVAAVSQHEKKVIATFDADHRKYLEEREKHMKNEKRDIAQTIKASSFAQVEPSAEEAQFEAQFRKLSHKVHDDVAAMTPGAAASLLETKPKETYATLAAKADALQKKMESDVAALDPDTPDIAGVDIGQQLQTYEDNVAPPMSLLQQGDPEHDAWERKMVEIGQKTSWAELAGKVKSTEEKAADELHRYGPSSFAQISANGEVTSAVSTRQQIVALQKKTHDEMSAANTEIRGFMSQTNADIEELRVPHTTIAQALARARARASSLLETAGASSFLQTAALGAVGDLTAASQLDALQAEQQRIQAGEQSALDQAVETQRGAPDASLMQESQQSDSQNAKASNEKTLQSLLDEIHSELNSLRGEQLPSSFVQTDAPSFDDIEARLAKLQSGVSAHLAKLQDEAAPGPSSFAEVHADVDMAVARAAARQATLAAARELQNAHGFDAEPITAAMLKSNETAQKIKFDSWHALMDKELAKGKHAEQLAEQMFGPLTSASMAAVQAKADASLAHLFGHKGAFDLEHGIDSSLLEAAAHEHWPEHAAAERSLLEVADEAADGVSVDAYGRTQDVPYGAAEDASLARAAAAEQQPVGASMKDAMASLDSFQDKLGKLPETFGKEFKKEVLNELHSGTDQ